MLKFKYLFENFELAKHAIVHWAHDGDGSGQLGYFRVSSNAIYPFTYDGELRFMRMAPVGEKSRTDIEAELEYLDYLADNGFPSLRLIPAENGEKLMTLDTEWGVWYACAFAQVRGVQVEDTDYSAEIMEACGETLGRMHCLSRTYAPKTRRPDHREILRRSRDALIESGAPEYIIDELDDVVAKMDALPVTDENYGLVHYDFEPDNVFWDADAHACGVIDFDDCMYNFFAVDIEQAIGSLREELGADSDQAEKSFFKGYEKACPLPEGYADIQPLMRRFVDIYAYARLTRAMSEPVADAPDWLDEIAAKLNTRLRGIETKVLGGAN